jgi:hypothetical protein
VADPDQPILDYAPPRTPSEHPDDFRNLPPTLGWQYFLYAALIMFAIAAGLKLGMG